LEVIPNDLCAPNDLRAALTVDKTPYQQDDHCTRDGTEETSLLKKK
jgi:hypothetical protein